MAEPTTIFQQITETEKVLSSLENRQELPSLNFRWGEKASSLLYSPKFEEFVEQLRKSMIEFESAEATTNLVTIELRLLGIRKEEIPKQIFRKLFNALVRKFDRDGLSQYYPYYSPKEFTRFPENEESELSTEDLKAIAFWKDSIIPDLKRLDNALKPEQVESEQETVPEKAPDEAVVVAVADEKSSTRRSRANRREKIREELGLDRETTAQSDALESGLDGQRLFLQEVYRESTIIEYQLIKAYAPDLGLNSLPTEVEEYIRGQVSHELQKNLSEYFKDGKISALGRGKLVRAVLSKLQRNPFFQVQLFQTFDKVAQEKKLQVEYKTQQLTPDDVERIGAQTDEDEQQDKNLKSYSEQAKVEFKQELKHILALSTLQEGNSIEAIADNILDFYPKIRNLDQLQNLDLRGFMPTTRFSVNQEEQELILKEVNKVIQQRFAQRELKPFTVEEKQEFKQAFEKALIVGAAKSEEQVDRVLDAVFTQFEQTETLSQINEETLSKALPADFFTLNQTDQEKVRQHILVYFKTGRLQQINPANFSSLQNAAWLRSQSPQEALRALLTAYEIDGTAVASVQIVQLLDSYALNEMSAVDLQENIGGLLNELDPRLQQNNELKEFLVLYVSDRKHDFAEYTNNPIATYSDPEANPNEATANVFHTDKLVRQYGTEVVAHAYFTKNLADLDVATDEQERVKREKGWKLRQILIELQREEFKKLSEREKEEYAVSLGVDRNAFIQANAQGAQEFNETAYENEIIDKSNPWGAPEEEAVDGGAQNSPETTSGGLNATKRFGPLRNSALKQAASKLVSTSTRKTLVAAGGAGLGGFAAGAVIGGILKSAGTAVATTGGIAGGAAVGWFIGGPIGAAVGGILGGISSYIVSGGSGNAAGITSAISPSLKSFSQDAFKTTSTGTNQFINASVETLTTSSIPGVAPATVTTAVVGTPIFLIITSIITISTIFTAFLPDASTTQVSPYFSTDIEESRYITVRKIPSIANATTPQIIHYKIEISKKADVPEEIIIKSITDTPSALNKDQIIIDPPQLSAEIVTALDAYKDQVLDPSTRIMIEFDLDTADSRFQDSLFRNDLKVSFTANGAPEQSNARAQTCFGDCPQSQVPACWPVLGWITQVPYGTGPLSNPIPNPETMSRNFTHYTGKLDSYDIGADAGEKIYAVAPGTVVVAGWQGGYGNLVVIDHGGWKSYYGHMPDRANGGPIVDVGDTVQGGQPIGHVDSTGKSDINHLHYEVRELNEFILISTFGIEKSGRSVLTNAPRCDEYYGNQ